MRPHLLLALLPLLALAACDSADAPAGPLTGTYSGTYQGVDGGTARATFTLEERGGRVDGYVTFTHDTGSETTWPVSGTFAAPAFDFAFSGSFYRGTASADGAVLTGEIGANAVSVPLTVRRR